MLPSSGMRSAIARRVKAFRYSASAAPGAPLVAPVLDPPCATFTGSTTVTITPGIDFPGSEIRYTTDGAMPTATTSTRWKSCRVCRKKPVSR